MSTKRSGTLYVEKIFPTSNHWHARNADNTLSVGQWRTWQEAVAHAEEEGFTVDRKALKTYLEGL